MRGRVLIGVALAGLVAMAARGHAHDKADGATLTIEAGPNGKVCVTQNIQGRKPLVLEIESRDGRFNLKYGDDTTISASQVRLEFRDGESDRIFARGDVRIKKGDDKAKADEIRADEIRIGPLEPSTVPVGRPLR